MLTFEALQKAVLGLCERYQEAHADLKVIPFARQTQLHGLAVCLARYIEDIPGDRSNERLKLAYLQDYQRTVLFAYLLAVRGLLNKYTPFYREVDHLILENDVLYQITSAIPGLSSIQHDYQYIIQQMQAALRDNKQRYALSMFCSHYIRVQQSYYINVGKGLTYKLSHIENRQ